ncbi:MAG: hypothetical protein ACOC4J_04840 [Bacteroidota bacterium]
MNEYNEIIKDLSENLNHIISLYEKTKEEKKELLEENSRLKKEIKSEQVTIEELKEETQRIKISKQLNAGDGENKEVKNRINRLVREIDKCIALLNK